MTATTVPLLSLAVVVAVQAVWLIIWGAKLTERVKTLERDVEPLKGLPLQLAKIGERQDIWIEQLKDLNSSIRWMREPSDMIGKPKGER